MDNKKKTSAIISFFKKALAAKNVKTIDSSRGGPHLRVEYNGDVRSLLNSIAPCNISPSLVSISGTYETNVLTLKNKISSVQGSAKGDSIYLVVATSSRGILKTKQLAPEKFGIVGKNISKSNYVGTVTSAINDVTVPQNIKNVMVSLLESSEKNSSSITEEVKTLSDTDVNIIAKDFGEITAACWFMNNYDKAVNSINFPTVSNVKLVDFFANKPNGAKVAISVKSGEGAPPSILSVAEVLQDMRFTDRASQKAKKAIIEIAENSVVDGIVEAAKALESDSYEWIRKNMFGGKHFNAADCEKAMARFNDFKSAQKFLTPYYNEIGRSASDMIAERIFNTKAKRNGMIISPMGYALVDEMNEKKNYLKVLNDAAKSLQVTQVYLKIKKSSAQIFYEVKGYSDSSFKFFYNANAGNPGLKKISFVLDKKA